MDYITALEIFNYDPDTGIVRWADHIPRKYFDSDQGYKVVNGRNAGKVIGNMDSGGYLQVRWKNTAYILHRIIWLMMTGDWPSEHIDHIDHVRTNNRFKNLRDIPKEHNNAHKLSNKSGYSDIFYQDRNTNRPWLVQVFSKGKYLTQRSFAELQDAIDHRDAIRKSAGLTQL